MTLISEAYREQNAELHARSDRYGTSGAARRGQVRPLSAWGRKEVLDFGCGKATLSRALGPAYHVTDYDPCIKGKDQRPEPHAIVVCGDVLEHVEPEYLDAVMKELRRLTKETIFAVIALAPSSQTLADGRNANLIIETSEWWRRKFHEHGFNIIESKPVESTVKSTWLIAQ